MKCTTVHYSWENNKSGIYLGCPGRAAAYAPLILGFSKRKRITACVSEFVFTETETEERSLFVSNKLCRAFLLSRTPFIIHVENTLARNQFPFPSSGMSKFVLRV